jgi:hypothetical protein
MLYDPRFTTKVPTFVADTEVTLLLAFVDKQKLTASSLGKCSSKVNKSLYPRLNLSLIWIRL